MRVVEPNNFSEQKKVQRSRKLRAFWFVSIVIALFSMVAFFIWQRKGPVAAGPEQTKVSEMNAPQVAAAETTVGSVNMPVKKFTGDQFKELYRSIAYPNTQKITEPISITGNATADARIRQLAEARGYHTTSIPVQSINKVVGFEEGDNLLQPLAYRGWQELKAAAAKDRIPLTIISAYRSPEYQRNLFLSRLLSPSVTPETIAAGQSDAEVEATLHITAVPGYSRHHTGYTADLWCQDGSGSFAVSSCFKWMNNDNYRNAKEHGWIPSYPSGTNEQGPEPEPWEYVWVGRDTLT